MMQQPGQGGKGAAPGGKGGAMPAPGGKQGKAGSQPQMPGQGGKGGGQGAPPGQGQMRGNMEPAMQGGGQLFSNAHMMPAGSQGPMASDNHATMAQTPGFPQWQGGPIGQPANQGYQGASAAPSNPNSGGAGMRSSMMNPSTAQGGMGGM